MDEKLDDGASPERKPSVARDLRELRSQARAPTFAYRLTASVYFVFLGAFGSASLVGIWSRSRAPFWASEEMTGVRLRYDALGAALALAALVLGVGFFWRKEWARAFSMALACVALFFAVGLKPITLAIHYLRGHLPGAEFLAYSWPSLWPSILGALALSTLLLLARPSFRKEYRGEESGSLPRP